MELLFISFVLLFLSRATGKRILSLIALSLDLDAEFFHKNGAFEPPSAFIRLLHYAGKFPLFFLALYCKLYAMELDYCISGDVNGPGNKEIIGAAAHTDYGMLTLLATDGTPGLQACFSFTSSNYSTILFAQSLEKRLYPITFFICSHINYGPFTCTL